MSGRRTRTEDPFLLSYKAPELRIASEFLSTWFPYLSRGLCPSCTRKLSDRIRSLDSVEGEDDAGTSNQKENSTVSVQNDVDSNVCDPENCDSNVCDDENFDSNSLGSWKDNADLNDPADTNSLGSWKDGMNGFFQPITGTPSTTESVWSPATVESSRVRISWADMAQEDELEAEEVNEVNKQLVDGIASSGEQTSADKVMPKTELPREQREYIRFINVKRKKDFICLERVDGKIVNIIDGLELHNSVFSAAEQKRIVEFIYSLKEKGNKGELRERTYTAPQKWMKGKGRVTIQFGCCYNYAIDKNGNPPGIIKNEIVDRIPELFKVIIRRLVRWHVLPPTCIPDSCIVNIYEEGDCIPPHIDNHDFVRPFCTVSFLSECNIVFGSNLKVIGPGEFSGSIAIPLPVGSVLVLNGKSADVAKHCIPAVPTKRISVTFRKMDESKRPFSFAPEPDLQGLQPLSFSSDRAKRSNHSNSKRSVTMQTDRRGSIEKLKISTDVGSDPHNSSRIRQGRANRQRGKINLYN